MKKHIPLNRLLVALMATAVGTAAHAQYAKMDGALSDFVDARAVAKTGKTLGGKALSATVRGGIQAVDPMLDTAGRVLVEIQLDGSVALDQFRSTLLANGAVITGENPSYRKGAFSALLPPDAIGTLAATQGLHVMRLATRPISSAGKVTSQGATVMRSIQANNAGFTGAGITVGVISDSYDKSTSTTIRAAADIASGDLPTPKFISDATGIAAIVATDEGRAMMQIVHDVAPGADQCFGSGQSGEAGYAAMIRNLRTNSACLADVIVDDLFYQSEPMFSDGQVALAVDDVATSTTLPGKPVAYFSAAGNQGGLYGRSGTVDVPNAQFSTTPSGLGNIDLSTVASCSVSPTTGNSKADVGGGWLDFGGGAYSVELTYAPGTTSTMTMQWDDPFLMGKLTTDLNLFFFGEDGKCFRVNADNNFTTDAAFEFAYSIGGKAGKVRVMVARAGAHNAAGDPWRATRVRLFTGSGFTGAPLQVGSNPVTFGHSGSANAISVAAYAYTSPITQQSPFIPAVELFTSPGPVTIYLDAAGNRLPAPEVRKKPDLAAPNRVNTTFFPPGGSDLEGDGFPNFAGTSAAAPHAAAVAALLLQKAGGPGKLTPKQIRSVLQTSAPARVLPHSSSTEKSKAWSLYDGYGLIDAVNALDKVPAP